MGSGLFASRSRFRVRHHSAQDSFPEPVGVGYCAPCACPSTSGSIIGLAFGAISGIICHIALPDSPQLVWVVENVANPIGQIFLRLLFMLVIPLVVSALILGVAELGDVRRLGKIGLKTLIDTVVVSSIAVFIGLTLVNVVQPGKGLPDHLQAELLDMARTTLNVTGDLAAAVVVSYGEEPPESPPYAPVGTSSQE